MKDPRAFIPVRYFDVMLNVLAENGIPYNDVLDGTGISQERMALPENLLTLIEAETLTSRALSIRVPFDLSFTVGARLHFTAQGMLGIALLTSPDIDSALHICNRFFSLITPLLHHHYFCDNSFVVLTIRPALPMSHDMQMFCLKTVAAAIHTQALFVMADRLRRIEINLPWTMPDAVWQQVLTEIDQATTTPFLTLRSPIELIKERLPLADPVAHAHAIAHCTKQLKCLLAPSAALTTRRHIETAKDSYPSFDTIALAMKLSASTLRRRLSDEGVSYREILSEVRLDRSREQLATSRLSVGEIAFAAGYSDDANFSRAFRRRFGTSPGAIRKPSA